MGVFRARIVRVVLLGVALLLLPRVSVLGLGAAPVAIVATVFRGSGCREPDDVYVKTRLDETGGMIRVGFHEPFVAAAGNSGRMTRLACNGVIPLVIEAGKRIGITQTRVAGRVRVPAQGSTAVLTTEFFFPGDRGPSLHQRFLHGDGSRDFEIAPGDGTIWSRCGGRQTLRVNAALMASGAETAISMEDGNGLGEGLEYEVSVRDCVADPRREL